MPKAVMLSHDNCTWTGRAASTIDPSTDKDEKRLISYLPLSHSAAMYIDVFIALLKGYHLYFADVKALQGTLF
jgi:long-chain-fatty-acid--CoA ligase ACSBG